MIGVLTRRHAAQCTHRVPGEDGGTELLLVLTAVAALARAATLSVGCSAVVLAPAPVCVPGAPGDATDGEGSTLGHANHLLNDHD